MERVWRSPHGRRRTLDLDLAEQPLDAIRVDQSSTQMLRGLRAARHAERQRLLDRAVLVAGGHETGQEGVAGADRGAWFDRAPAHPDAVEDRLPLVLHACEAAVGHGHDRLARAELAD